jgi:hypothetical protein
VQRAEGGSGCVLVYLVACDVLRHMHFTCICSGHRCQSCRVLVVCFCTITLHAVVTVLSASCAYICYCWACLQCFACIMCCDARLFTDGVVHRALM